MKGTVFSVLQDIEKLIYKVLLWVILIPKTIIKITVNPKWALGYVSGEINPPKDAHDKLEFDEYLSPVILLLVVAWLPALGFGLLPIFGTTLTSSAIEKPTTDRFISFTSQTEFISSSARLEYSHLWIVEQKQNDGSYKLIYDEFHGQFSEKNYIEIVDNNTVKDKFLYTFNDPGEYLVTVLAEKFDPRREDQSSVNLYKASIAVNVPLDVAEPIVVLDTTDTTESAPENKQAEDFSERVKQEDTLFLALALMMPPLLFAFVIRIRSREGRANIGEDTLKEVFYLQCYYFSPLSLAIWATFYAVHFYTADIFFYWSYGASLVILFLPILLSTLWFFRVQMQIIINAPVELPATSEASATVQKFEDKPSQTSSLDAFLIVVGCVLLLSLGAWVVFFFPRVQDILRIWTIRLYPLAAIGLMGGFGYYWYQRRKQENKRITARNLSWVFAGTLMLLLMILVIRFMLFPVSQSSASPSDVAATPVSTTTLIPIEPLPSSTGTAEPVAVATTLDTPIPTDTELAVTEARASQEIPATPTPIPTATPTEPPPSPTATPESPQFYTENFTGDLVNWSEFLSSGDPKMVERRSEPGKYAVDLLQSEDKLARYYLINDNFTYANVKVEAVVVNRGNNTNGASLICRYSDVGWYEVLISNGGTYSIFAVDRSGIVNQGYNLIDIGTSVLIRSGLGASNTYTLVCKGNELSLFINQEPVNTIADVKFQFQEGKIGIGVSSPERLPVKIEFESVTVSEP